MAEANIPVVTNKVTRAKTDKVIVFGCGGSGKTVSTVTALIDAPANRRLIYLMTERNSLAGIKKGLDLYKITPNAGQLLYVFPKQKAKAFSNLGRAITAFTKQTKTDALKGTGATSTQGKEHYTYLTSIIQSLENFKGIDWVTNEEVTIGNVGQLTENDILVIDGLSPIANEVWKSTVGDKIAIGQNDYMPAQQLMLNIMYELSVLDCSVILLAHEKPLTDANGLFLKTVVNTGVGNSNYEQIMGCFTDCIHSVQIGVQYKWEGNKNGVACVARSIPKEANLEPNFSKYNFFQE
jgi:hypothetical protein